MNRARRRRRIPPTDPDLLARSYDYCAELTRERARNFYFGLRLTPQPKRNALYAVYAWNRAVDDLADQETDVLDAEDKIELLDAFRAQTVALLNPYRQLVDPEQAEPEEDDEDDEDDDEEEDEDEDDDESPMRGADELLWPAVRDVLRGYGIPMDYLHAMIDGQVLDQVKTRYATFEELYDYCYKVASVVGLTCIEVWGYDDRPETRKLSEWRGIAFQLTNILRDIREDAQRDRVYLPAEMFGTDMIEPASLRTGAPRHVIDGIRDLTQRAVDYYRRSAPLEHFVHPHGRPCLRAMTGIYQALLERIRRDPAAVLGREPVRVPSWRKALIAWRATRKRSRGA